MFAQKCLIFNILVEIKFHNVDTSNILVQFNQIWIFLRDFNKIFQYQISLKSILWEMSGQMDREKVLFATIFKYTYKPLGFEHCEHPQLRVI